MGSDRRKYQDKSKAQVSINIRNELHVTMEEAFKFWQDYQKGKKENLPLWRIMTNLYAFHQYKVFQYFIALAMEIVTKEIIEGIQVDKKEN